MNREERWRDEVELLEAMLADDEFQKGSTKNSVVVTLGQLKIYASLTETKLKGGGERERETLRSILNENPDEICLVQIVQALSDMSTTTSQECEHAVKTSLSTVVLRIDHMNDRTTYLNRIQKWLTELDIVGDIMFREDGKRAKNILCALHGEKKSMNEFLRLLRTQKLTRKDVTEKQSKILWQSDNHDKFEMITAKKLSIRSYSDWSELESLWNVSNSFRGPSFSELLKL